MKNTDDNKKSLENSLNKAISDMDFSQINEKIKESLDTFVGKTMDFLNEKTKRSPKIQTKNPEVCSQSLPEKSLSVVLKIGAGLSGFMFLAMLIVLVAGGFTYGLISNFIFTIIFGLITAMTYSYAKKIDERSKDYKRFLRELGHNTVIPIRDLASAVQKKEKDLVDELLVMMKKGYFKQARIVENNSLFLLDIPTFKLYKKEKQGLSSYTSEKREKIEETAHDENSKQMAQNIVKLSNKYLNSISLSISRIENRAFLEKVIEIKKTIQNIINIIKKYPEKSYALDKFMDYYLPTTVKLIDAYTEYEMMSSKDEDIIKALKEIDLSILTINEAFEKIQLELVEGNIMDIKTDIDTLKLLLNQEGYLKKDWSIDEWY